MEEEKIYRPQQVCDIYGFSKPTLWRKVKSGDLPNPIRLGSNSVGFLASEIQKDIARRAAERGTLVVPK